jgi:hypothetical protein
MIWSLLANLLGGPIVNGLLDGYKAKLAAGTSSESLAVDLAKKGMEVDLKLAELNQQITLAEEGRWWTALPRALVTYAFAIYVFKVVVWDTVLGWGSTPALHGDISVWAGWLMGMWFGGRTIEKVARIIKR